MSVPLILTFVSTVVVVFQFLIFVALYSSQRVRFFPYLLWANGRGRLSLEATRENGDVALTVSDTGQGIPPENLRHLFELFYSGKPNGLGLDLAIAQRITRAHGGRNGR